MGQVSADGLSSLDPQIGLDLLRYSFSNLESRVEIHPPNSIQFSLGSGPSLSYKP